MVARDRARREAIAKQRVVQQVEAKLNESTKWEAETEAEMWRLQKFHGVLEKFETGEELSEEEIETILEAEEEAAWKAD